MSVVRIAVILSLLVCYPVLARSPQAAPVAAADLYLSGAKAVYRVNLHTGQSQHVGDLDATIQHLAYDSDSHTLYGVGYRQIIQPNGDIEHGLYRIDTHAWSCTYITQLPAAPSSPDGAGGAVFPSLCYDHTTGWLYGSSQPRPPGIVGETLVRADPRTNQRKLAQTALNSSRPRYSWDVSML
jgi:hypothetical protein